MGELKIYIRQHITIQKTTGQAGYYQGTNPQNLNFVQGTLPSARQWATFPNWYNATDYVSDLYKLKIIFTQKYDNLGNPTTEGGLGAKRAVTGTLTFEQDGYSLIKQWLKEDVSAPLNIVDVMIEDVGCGYYMNFQITANEIIYCENEVCTFSVNIKQADPIFDCISRTLISDNWQGWFPVNGKPIGKMHPRFSYCNEIRPNGFFTVQMTVFMVLSIFITLLAFVFGTVYNIIAAVVNVVISIINFIKSLGFGGATINTLPFFSYKDFLDTLGVYYIEMLGCGREHPAPLIRDYIKNVCAKCGVTVDNNSAPLFFNSFFTTVSSDINRGTGGQITQPNPHYNACYLHALSKRGVRRFETLNVFTGYSNPNSTAFWLEDNKPIHTLDTFLDEVTDLYNHEWEIRNVNNTGQQVPTLFIYRKDKYKQAGAYLYDFTKNGIDRSKIVDNTICYESNGKTYPAYLNSLYQDDAVDTCGNEAKGYYNDVVSFGDVTNNPNFKGGHENIKPIGMAKFRLDGASTDYALDALQTALNVVGLAVPVGLVFAPLFVPIINSIRNNLVDYGNYALLLKDETCNLPKILLWNGGQYLNAKCIADKYSVNAYGATPQINPVYNTGLPWDFYHYPETYVIGGTLTIPQSPYGAYKISDFLGLYINETYPAKLVNYPMFFETKFYDTMWDWFWWIENPLKNGFLNQDFSLKIEKCCDDLKILGVFNDANDSGLMKRVKVDGNYNNDGRITEITVSYDPEDEDGQFIEIKGQV